jgi:aqualysin 1
MSKVVLLIASMLAATLLLAGSALTQTQPAVDHADRYIVVLDDEVDHPSQVASDIEQRQDLEVGFVYSNALEGFSAEIPDQSLAAMRADPRVDYVEPDGKVHTVTVQTLPWGINKIDADQSSTLAGNGWGAVSNVNAYIIDTGIYKKHPDLNVVNHVNFAGGLNTDCNGHGTHVAGSVAARDNSRGVVGAAPGAPLTGVKVIGCSGSGLISTVIQGIEWVTKEVSLGPDGIAGTADDNDKKPAIANLSLSGVANQALDDAVRNSRNSGVFYSVAAGNNGKDACNYSPARAGSAERDTIGDTNGDGKVGRGDSNGIVTTAALRVVNKEPDWSNNGPCVDLWAPGKNILSTKMGGGTTVKTGTSIAAAHVGGTAALYLSNNTGASPVTVESSLKEDAQLLSTESETGRTIKRVYAGGY